MSCVKCFAEVITFNSKSHAYFTNEDTDQVMLRVSWLEFLYMGSHTGPCVRFLCSSSGAGSLEAMGTAS